MTKRVSLLHIRNRHSLSIADYSSPVFFWSVIELSLTVISACLPTLGPIVIRYKQTSASKRSDLTPNSGASSSRNRYIRSRSNNDGYELPVLNDIGSPNQTSASEACKRDLALSADDGIIVQKEFSSTASGGGATEAV